MVTIQLKRTDNSDLMFEGELLAKVSSPTQRTADGERGYQLGLYANSKGGFVASFKYLTTVSTEKSIHSADVLDEPKDVENFFLVMEPCQHVDHEMLEARPRDQRSQFRKAMCALYDRHVDVILKALQDFSATQKNDPQSKLPQTEEKPAGNRGMLSFFGLK